MNFLFPLYLLGLAAVAIPVILHLRRRPPKERTDFSSLMFLEATPMERKRRRKLENLLLLLMRCALICLLAFLFARPLFRGTTGAGAGGEGSFTVVLLDRSASMQREDLWARAVEAASERAAEAGPSDLLALVVFDSEAEVRVSFERWGEEAAGRRGELVTTELKTLEAGWRATDLGTAVAVAVELIDEGRNAARSADGAARGPGSGARAEILLVSDLQAGADLQALEAIGWPEATEMAVEILAPKAAGNASLHLLTSEKIITLREEGKDEGVEEEDEEEGALRLRLANEATSIADEFEVGWKGGEEEGESFVLAPGLQRSFRRAVPEGGSELVLRGDEHDFDNRVFVAPEAPRPLRIVYLDEENEEGERERTSASSPLFYLERAVQATNLHAPQVNREWPGDGELSRAADFLVIAGDVEEGRRKEIADFVSGGGKALVLLGSDDQGEMLGSLSGVEGFSLEEAALDGDYALLEQIDFDDVMLGAFEDPRLRDFSKVRFWKYRRVAAGSAWPESARVLARFDSGDEAWLSLPVGEGELVVFAAGWHPADSQLGLSTKFVPLLYSLLESGRERGRAGAQFVVGDVLPVSEGEVVRGPEGQDEGAEAEVPGIYRVTSPGSGAERAYAVNLDYRESRIEVLALERLEEAGIVLTGREKEVEATGEAAAAEPNRERYILDVEQEKRQQLWRWLVAGAILIVFLEMLVAGRGAQPGATEPV